MSNIEPTLGPDSPEDYPDDFTSKNVIGTQV